MMRRRWSLRALAFVPLILAPLFLSLALAVNVMEGRTPGMGLEVFVIAAAYSTALTVHGWWINRGTVHPQMQSRPFLRMLLRGSIAGALFGALFVIPLAFTTYDFRNMSLERLGKHLVNFSVFALYMGVTFSLIGTACGGVFGLVIQTRNRVVDRNDISLSPPGS